MVPALLVGLLLSAVAAAARGAIADAAFLYAATIAMGAGVSIVQTVMPPLVRSWFPQRIGLATSVYTNGLLIGEILPVGLTIPFVLPLLHGSWRLDFVVWSVPVLATALLVALCTPDRRAVGKANIAPNRRWWPDWRDPLIWRLGLILGSVNATYFVTNAFLPDYVVAAGRPDLVSSALTALNRRSAAGFLPHAAVGRAARYPALGLCGDRIIIVSQRHRHDARRKGSGSSFGRECSASPAP